MEKLLTLVLIISFMNMICLGVVKSFFKQVLNRWNKGLAILIFIPPMALIAMGMIIIGGMLMCAWKIFEELFCDYFKK